MSGFQKNLSPGVREKHYRFLIQMFGRPVHRITERRGGAVFKTEVVGTVVSYPTASPFRPGTTSGL